MPRLIAGQIAPGIAAKAAATRKSVLSRMLVLSDARNMSGKNAPDRKLQEHLLNFDSVSLCSAWSWPERGITPLSTKTLKKYLCELGTDPSELQAEALRLRGSPKPHQRKNEPDKTDHLVDKLLMMTAQYLDLLERLIRLRGQDGEIDHILSMHFALYEDPSRPKPELRVLK